MTFGGKDLTNDKNYWKTEQEIQEKAQLYIKQFMNVKPYDIHKLQPHTYDLKMVGDPNSGGRKKNSKEIDKKKADAEKKQKKKAAAKLGNDTKAIGLLDDIEEEAKAEEKDSSDDESDEGGPDDKYDPLSKHKEGAP